MNSAAINLPLSNTNHVYRSFVTPIHALQIPLPASPVHDAWQIVNRTIPFLSFLSLSLGQRGVEQRTHELRVEESIQNHFLNELQEETIHQRFFLNVTPILSDICCSPFLPSLPSLAMNPFAQREINIWAMGMAAAADMLKHEIVMDCHPHLPRYALAKLQG